MYHRSLWVSERARSICLSFSRQFLPSKYAIQSPIYAQDRAKQPPSLSFESCSQSTPIFKVQVPKVNMGLLRFLAFVPLVVGFPALSPRAGCWTLNSVQTVQRSGRDGGNPNSTISFEFSDPGTSTSSSCDATWVPAAPPVNYMDCSDRSFRWRFREGDHTTISNFTLQLEHIVPLPRCAFSPSAFEHFRTLFPAVNEPWRCVPYLHFKAGITS